MANKNKLLAVNFLFENVDVKSVKVEYAPREQDKEDKKITYDVFVNFLQRQFHFETTEEPSRTAAIQFISRSQVIYKRTNNLT